MVEIEKTWQTIHFTAKRKGYNPQSVELTFNHKTRMYSICTGNEEGVSFEGDSIVISMLKLQALKACINYINKELLK